MSDKTVLTDERVDQICKDVYGYVARDPEMRRRCARAIERAVLAAATPGQVEESIEEDVYYQIVEMMTPYVNAECTASTTSLPASVAEAFQYLLDFWKSASVSEQKGESNG